MNTLNLAQQLIDGEIENFQTSSLDYIRSLGWDVKGKYSNIKDKCDDVSANKQDYENLKSIIDSKIAVNSDATVLDIVESGSVSDFLCNMLAGKILELYKKK